MNKIRQIEISFPVPVELPLGFDRVVDALVNMVCKYYEQENPTRVMWPAGHGSKPNFSQVDALVLGKDVNPNAPKTGEPTWDDDVYHIDVAEREAYEKELQRRRRSVGR